MPHRDKSGQLSSSIVGNCSRFKSGKIGAGDLMDYCSGGGKGGEWISEELIDLEKDFLNKTRNL